MSRYDLSTDSGRRRAWRNLLWGDHGVLRWRFRNRWQITPRMARSNQPLPAHLEDEARLGTRTIVNLRGPSDTGFYALQREACERLGLTLVDFRFRSRDVPAPDEALAWKALLAEIKYPALIHCKSGADRAGIAAALYLVFQEGMDVEQAKDRIGVAIGPAGNVVDGTGDGFVVGREGAAAPVGAIALLLEPIDQPGRRLL